VARSGGADGSDARRPWPQRSLSVCGKENRSMISGKDAAPPHPGALSEPGALAALVQSGGLACRERVKLPVRSFSRAQRHRGAHSGSEK
jgi:hypothetical protein